jgi:histidyl-tRNA synthetase
LPLEAEATYRKLWSVQSLVSENTSDLLIKSSRLRGPLDKVNREAAKLLAGTPATAALEELLSVARNVAMYQLGDFEVVLGIARGFTFYTSTIFEISAGNGFAGAKYCGGGRYDRLVEEFGGPSLPSTGCGFRFDDIVDAFIEAGNWTAPRDYDLVLVAGSDALLTAAVAAAETLRRKGVRVGVEAGTLTSVGINDRDARKTNWLGRVTEDAKVYLSQGAAEHPVPLDAAEIEKHLE